MAVALVVMVALPVAEMAARTALGSGVPGSAPLTQHLVLWAGFLGALVAAREGRLLSLATGALLPEGRWRDRAGVVAATVATAVSALLARASLDLVGVERQAGSVFALGMPVWAALLVMPLAFVGIAVRLAWRCGGWQARIVAALGGVAGALLPQAAGLFEGGMVWPWLALVLLATILGAPIFVALGGAAALLFLAEGVSAAAVPVEAYRLTVSPTLPAIPLFTLAGFALAEGAASRRLLDVFHALFGWIPGGTAVVAALLCAFFTVLTGGSGVTILAVGALLHQTLLADGYRDRFAVGMLTGASSLGLLFPPAVPLILYGIVAQLPIEHLFIGGLLPGLLLVAMMAAWGVREGLAGSGERRPFDLREAGRSLWRAKWEMALPAIALVAIFGGFATLVEAAALVALYALVVQTVVQRDIRGAAHLVRVIRDAAVLVGGVLLIFAVALGLTSYLVDAQVPALLLDAVKAHVDSPLVFLLGLNLFLLVVGCLMDIFSAIVVVVPLLVPLGEAFGIHPVHLGIVFVANLELGYLTPPVGLNLFLASYRFERPIAAVWKAALPALVILGVGVLAITYLPPLTTGLLAVLGRG